MRVQAASQEGGAACHFYMRAQAASQEGGAACHFYMRAQAASQRLRQPFFFACARRLPRRDVRQPFFLACVRMLLLTGAAHSTWGPFFAVRQGTGAGGNFFAIFSKSVLQRETDVL